MSAGRWHLPGRHATQYMSADPDGAWAELIRHEGLRSEDDAALVHMQMWAVDVDQANLVDYSTFAKVEAAGFSPGALIDDDWAGCQGEGQLLRSLGYAGVVAPSAALPGAVNITIFGRRIRTTWGHSTRLASAIPACVVAVGSPPPGLVGRVRHYGEAHLGYERFLEENAEPAGIERPDEAEELKPLEDVWDPISPQDDEEAP